MSVSELQRVEIQLLDHPTGAGSSVTYPANGPGKRRISHEMNYRRDCRREQRRQSRQHRAEGECHAEYETKHVLRAINGQHEPGQDRGKEDVRRGLPLPVGCHEGYRQCDADPATRRQPPRMPWPAPWDQWLTVAARSATPASPTRATRPASTSWKSWACRGDRGNDGSARRHACIPKRAAQPRRRSLRRSHTNASGGASGSACSNPRQAGQRMRTEHVSGCIS